MRRSMRLGAVPYGVNVVGFVTGNLGLGVATRNTISLLKSEGVRVAATDLDPGLDRAGHDDAHKVLHGSVPYRTPFLVTLYHLNPTELSSHLQVNPGLSRHDRVAAIVPFWELETLPPGWADVLAAMDIILTPSSFIRSAVRRAYRKARLRPQECPPAVGIAKRVLKEVQA